MAGETAKTEAICLTIHPWSRTSHVVTWLTADAGPLTLLVKGAVRPKSAFLGQYDLFYTCELVYYAKPHGDLHLPREITPLDMRDTLRTNWRAASLAGYACDLVRELAPTGPEARTWFDFLTHFLDSLRSLGTQSNQCLRTLIRLEMDILRLAGLAPDFSGAEAETTWFPFAIDAGRVGEGLRTIRLTAATVNVLRGGPGHLEDAVRFLGLFLAYHLERPADIRRSLVHLLA